MTISEGMDAERIRSIAAALGTSGERIRAVRGDGSASMLVLDEAWAGADLGGFSRGWAAGAGRLESAATAVQHLQRELLRQAEDQDTASGGGGGSGGGASSDATGPEEDPFFDDLVGEGTGGDGSGWSLPTPFGGLGDAWDRGSEALDDAWDWGVERGRDAVEWGRGGLEWLGDRGEELVDGVQTLWDDEVVARWDAGLAALERLGPSVVNLGEQVTQVFTEGRWPRFHEVAASAILLIGRSGGLVANVVTGTDRRIFESGQGVVTSVIDVPTESADDRGRVPTDLNALMDIQSDTYDRDRTGDATDPGNRHVRVTAVEQPDGSSAYIVTVPGTNGLFDFPGSITGGDEAFDNTANLELQAGERSASMEAVMAAMEEAGIPPGAPVMLQGHSQGGMVTAELVRDEEFLARYSVTHMLTQGSPNDSRSIPTDVQTLAIEHTNDIVPKVDLGDAYAGPPVPIPLPGPLPPVIVPMTPIPNFDPALAASGDHVTRVRLDPNPGVAPFGVPDDMNAHHYDQYAETVRRELAADNPAFTGYGASEGIHVFLTDDPGAVTITEYGTGRE